MNARATGGNASGDTKKGPLHGIYVVDCTQWIQGGMLGVILGDLGADVIKVENPVTGDELRGWLQSGLGAQTHRVQRNYVFEQCNRGKRSMTLDLKKEDGREILYALVRRADVFMHNWRGEAIAKKLGVDYETLIQINPRLVYSHSSGWGPKGPMSELPAYEIAAQARSGMVHVCREPDGPPIIFPGGVGDITGAAFAAIGILSGLVARGHLNRGQKIDTSLLGSLLQVVALQIGSSGIAGEIYPQRSRSRMGNPLWNYYKCADGKWINFAMLQPDKYWHNFCYAVGIPELEKDPRFNNLTVRARNALELIDILDRIFITKTREEWLKQLDKSGVDLIYGPIQTIPEVLQDPQVLANEYVVDFEHPVFGPIKYVGVPHLFSETPANPRKAAPEFGQHTEEILLELGYTCEDIGRFKDKGVI